MGWRYVASLALWVAAASPAAAQDRPPDLFDVLQAHCGKAYAGSLTTSDEADAAMRGAAMVIYVASCSPTEIRIPFHIASKDAPGGWDRSRTWVLTRRADGLLLRHDHRHADGTEDALTQYGGLSVEGPATVRSFPIDAQTTALFQRAGLTRSLTNVWEMAITADRFTYELLRDPPNQRHFNVTFDLTQPVDAPPPAWGDEAVLPPASADQ